MSILCISVSERGVLRVDVLYAGADDYPHAADFHKELAPEISRLDRLIKRRKGVAGESDDTH
jgi:hypothetical protein